ncbi:hypothetical protein J2W40_003810 [Sphingobium xenophagum]|uniref:Uncharacterized protein n=1 Tax=Sphingobium xenophagum TaxID=121428 RepID=A0ABU1X5W5_SPHXE|nr:hypothetical protein [Sphingobium xenophagum]MDR7156964.1 hypothetical protein [Sphingobium xenophagum]
MTVVAVLLLRHAWGLRARSVPLLVGAWALLVLGLIAAGAGHGAWGVSVACVSMMLCAFACLAVAGWTAPRDKARPPQRRAHILPDAGEPSYIGRRLLTFLITVPLALVASLALALAMRVWVSGSGGGEANANVVTLFLTPLLWSILVVLLMLARRRRTQWLMLGVPLLVGGLSILWGTM